MTDIRKKFTENAEQFDALVVEMLAENEKLKKENEELIDILVVATHHAGALEECSARWSPIVSKELNDRFKS